MSIRHPIISVTGSSGSGTTSVRDTFEQIFRRERIVAAFVDGDAFHRYDRDGMRRFYRAVDRLGLPIHITEFDVDETHLPRAWARTEKDRSMAWLAGRYVADAMANARLAELCWWHLRSDLNYIAREKPELQPQPSPYDAASRPLPMYEATVQALRGRTRAG